MGRASTGNGRSTLKEMARDEGARTLAVWYLRCWKRLAARACFDMVIGTSAICPSCLWDLTVGNVRTKMEAGRLNV